MQLNRTLGFKDIVLLNVTAIVGLRWISLAATGGNTSITLWILACIIFFIPQAFAVIDLTKRMPGEGGLYIWARETLGPFHGFFSGWCYWASTLTYFPNLLVYIAGISVYIWMAGNSPNKAYIIIFSLALLWFVAILNVIGLRIGRWVNNIGGYGTWITGTVLIVFGIIAAGRFGLANPMPAPSFFTGILSSEKLIFLASICFAFTGLELASVLGDEVRNPEKTIPRAIIASGFIISFIYILGTWAVMAALPTQDINIISGFLQGISVISLKMGFDWAPQILAILITVGGIGGLMAWFTGSARIPFVAGIDDYLPKKFGETHPKYNTPHYAILFQAGMATLFLIMSFAGSKIEEAYMVLLDTTLLVTFIPYLYLFASYLNVRWKENDPEKAFPKSRAFALTAGASGFIVTLAAIILTVFPSDVVENIWFYEAKVLGGVFAFLFSGWYLYSFNTKKLKTTI